MPSIARVVVQLSLNREFDYRIPPSLEGQVRVGTPVVVPFGKGSARGYVVGLPAQSPHPKLKPITSVIGKKSLISPPLLELARWMSDYYLAPVEQAVAAVLPGVIREKPAGFVERLMVTPTEQGQDVRTIEAVRRRAPKQAAVLDRLLEGTSVFLSSLAQAAGASTAAVRALERKGLVRISRSTVERSPDALRTLLPTQALALMPQQADALAVTCRAIDTRDPRVVLLYGVTGSGKTEVYLQAMQHALTQDRGAIVLVPEIALTPQTVERFRGRFGDIVAVLHSHLSDGERHDEWHRVHDGRARIVIGARSALFAPVRNLGLIVVDEEHEPTYKQEEVPRYHARDVAVMRGVKEDCAVLLGSATPSLESWNNALRGRYGLARMPHRVDHREMPLIRVVDLRTEFEREGRHHVLSRDLLNAMRDRLARAEQIILFLNRRGYATSLVCPRCGHVARCTECSVAFTYHKQRNRLVCHICGGDHAVPSACPNVECRDPAFRYAGLGTERIEETLRKVLPKARVRRMDSDTMTRKSAYHEVLGDFRTGKIDILVGTQMIAKGLDFPNVTLVGVINADVALHRPDFRAGERAFQLLTQVAGRAGRGEVSGEVIVQTFTPYHPAIQAARRMDFEGFCDQELEFRRELSYPPFGRLVCLTLRGPDERAVQTEFAALAKRLAPYLPPGATASDPSPAPLARARGQFRYQLLMRGPSAAGLARAVRRALEGTRRPKGLYLAIDMDAYSLM